MYFFPYRLYYTTCLKIGQLDIIFDLEKISSSHTLLILFKNVLEQKMIWLLEKILHLITHHGISGEASEQSILILFLEDYHDVINEGLKVHLSLILITGVKTNKPAY